VCVRVLKLHYFHGSVYFLFPRSLVFRCTVQHLDVCNVYTRYIERREEKSGAPRFYLVDIKKIRSGRAREIDSIIASIILSHTLSCRSRGRGYSVRERWAVTTIQSGPGRPKETTTQNAAHIVECLEASKGPALFARSLAHHIGKTKGISYR
jgi:hypothetical protein